MEPATTTTQPAQQIENKDVLGPLIGRLAHAIESELSPGDVAELRRLEPGDPSAPAFWKVIAAHIEPKWKLPPTEPGRSTAERQWAALLSAMARLQGMHDQRQRLGHALAQAQLSELRFDRLLRAHDEALLDQLRSTVHFVAAKGVAVNCRDLADLLLSDGTERAEKVRRRLARDYFTTISKNTKEG
ncbi:MAG: type I-E CRISPR-associated protein Cse2/CasB [Deltaproteobacteria bacterium]|nr:type I-E CRISPR-associated protein Cse2/CasB [Deltaproteobacteria bacterium]